MVTDAGRTLLGAVVLASALGVACRETAGARRAAATRGVRHQRRAEGRAEYLELVGQTQGFQDVEIRARVEGFLETVNFREGSFVRKGDLLYTIDRKPLEATLAGRRPTSHRAGPARKGQKRRRPLHAARGEAGSQPAGAGQRAGGARRGALTGGGGEGRRRQGDARSRLHAGHLADQRAGRHDPGQTGQPGGPRRDHAAHDHLADRPDRFPRRLSPKPTTCASSSAIRRARAQNPPAAASS